MGDVLHGMPGQPRDRSGMLNAINRNQVRGTQRKESFCWSANKRRKREPVVQELLREEFCPGKRCEENTENFPGGHLNKETETL